MLTSSIRELHGVVVLVRVSSSVQEHTSKTKSRVREDGVVLGKGPIKSRVGKHSIAFGVSLASVTTGGTAGLAILLMPKTV
jgi:hypothetical protein